VTEIPRDSFRPELDYLEKGQHLPGSGHSDIVSSALHERSKECQMFEEVVVWRRVDARYAIRYFGFRNLQNSHVWIAFANHLWFDDERDICATEMIAPQGILESFLGDLPKDPPSWRPTISEAVEAFINRQATEMDSLESP
jgi:hypothetical protein